MNRYRLRHPDHKTAAKSRPDDDSGSTDFELTSSADDIYSVAAKHRDGVKKKDAAAKARRKGARRG
jgi:hypothetical protein